MKKYLSAFAKDHFSKICEESQKEPVLIGKYNDPNVVIVSYKDFRRLSRNSDDDWALLATTATMEGFMDDDEVADWLKTIRDDENRRQEIDDSLNDQIFDKIKISKVAQSFLGEFTSENFQKIIKSLLDDKYPSYKLGKWHYQYKDIGKCRFIYDMDKSWYRLIFISMKSKFQLP